MKIIQAKAEHMDIVRDLFRDYQAWLNNDICFHGFEEELASLPGRYDAPRGAVYLAFEKDEVVACSAIRPRIDKPETEAEFKRLFVKDVYRGHGLGRDIFNAAMLGAKAIGYKTVVLETLPEMTAAQHLYLDYGFEPIDAYFENADESVSFFRYTFDKST